MDLSSLLNGGNAGLTTEDLLRLLQCDNFEKLDKISNAVFQYPSATKETYYFFDIFIQLLLSILNNVESTMQHTKPVIMEALRNCIKGILEQEGFNWLLTYPHHVSLGTWNQLKVSTDKTLLRHLYGFQLGLKKQDTIELGAWTRALLQFLRVQSPILTCHIWLNLCYLEEQRQHQLLVLPQQQQQQQQRDASNSNVCLMFLDELERGGATDMLMEVFPILENGDKQKLIDELETHLGDAILLYKYSEDEMVVSLMRFGNLVRSNKILYPRIKMSLDRFVYNTGGLDLVISGPKSGKKSKGKKKPTPSIEHNPLGKNGVLGQLSDDIKGRSLQVQQGTKWWLQQMGTLLPIEFNLHLEELISHLYPSANRRVLDFVLMDWAARDPFDCHMELIVKNVMNLVDSSAYNSERAPFYAWIQTFDLSHDTRVSEIAKGYNIKTGAEINLSKFNTKHDVDLVNGLVKILQHMSLHSTPASDRFILDCIIAATPEIVLGYVEWVVQLLNKEFEHNDDDATANSHSSKKLQQTAIAEHLKKVLSHPAVMSIASLLVPAILLQASEHTIAWMTNKKTDRVTSPAVSTIQILMEYFSGGSHLSSKLLVTDLLRRKSKAYIDTLIDCLRKRMADPLPSSSHCRTWFTRHFLGPILSEASNVNINNTTSHARPIQEQQEDDQDQSNVASQLLQTMLTKTSLFLWYFTTLVTPDRKQKLAAIDTLAMSQHHTIYSVRGNGLADMIQKMVQLNVTQQQRIVNLWITSWTTSTAADDNTKEKKQQLAVDDTRVLQCIGLYDQAPAVVKQMMEYYMKLGIQSRVRNGEIVAETPKEGSFTEMVMDLLMLSDAPEVDELFDLYLQLCYHEKATWEMDQEAIVLAVVRTLIILAEEIKLIYDSQSFGGACDGGNDVEDADETMGDELDEYTNMMDMDPVATTVDEQAINIKTHNKSDAGKSRKQRKLLSQQRELQVQRFAVARKKANTDRRERQIEKDQLRVRRKRQRESLNKNVYRNKMMATLVQRLLNFILIILSESGGNSLCPEARQSVKDKLVRNLLLYEPLSTLNQLAELSSDTVDDIHMIVGLCLEILQKDGDTTTPEIIQRIIGDYD